MLSRLRHRTIGGAYNNNGTIHLRRTGNHILNVVSMTRTIHVRIMTIVCLILNVSDSDSDTTLFFFRCLINLIKSNCFSISFLRKDLCNRSSQRRLAMINVTNRSNVQMRFVSDKFLFCHLGLLQECFKIVYLFIINYISTANFLTPVAFATNSSAIIEGTGSYLENSMEKLARP